MRARGRELHANRRPAADPKLLHFITRVGLIFIWPRRFQDHGRLAEEGGVQTLDDPQDGGAWAMGWHRPAAGHVKATHFAITTRPRGHAISSRVEDATMNQVATEDASTRRQSCVACAGGASTQRIGRMRPPKNGAKFSIRKSELARDPALVNAPRRASGCAGKRVLMYCTVAFGASGPRRCCRSYRRRVQMAYVRRKRRRTPSLQRPQRDCDGPRRRRALFTYFPDGGYWAGANFCSIGGSSSGRSSARRR